MKTLKTTKEIAKVKSSNATEIASTSAPSVTSTAEISIETAKTSVMVT